MQVIFSQYAQLELDDATQFYEMEYEGLGRRFRKEVKGAVVRVSEYPKAWSIECGEIRKCLLHKFPYKILYSVEKDHVFVIAIAHRQPDYWVDREM